MTFSVTSDREDEVGRYVMERTNGEWYSGMGSTMGVFDEGGRLVAGLVFSGYNGANVYVALAAEPGVNWLSRALARTICQYVFLQLGCRRVTCTVAASNSPSLRVCQFLGCTPEAVMPQGAPDGDLIVLSQFRATSPWLTEEERYGQQQ
jgi:RimJ/RimL family protein N-acetyltransferase